MIAHFNDDGLELIHEKLCLPMSPDSAHGLLDLRVKVWRRHGKHYADAALQHFWLEQEVVPGY